MQTLASLADHSCCSFIPRPCPTGWLTPYKQVHVSFCTSRNPLYRARLVFSRPVFGRCRNRTTFPARLDELLRTIFIVKMGWDVDTRSDMHTPFGTQWLLRCAVCSTPVLNHGEVTVLDQSIWRVSVSSYFLLALTTFLARLNNNKKVPC
jgi:hypothetical protein